jgi:hypothetical protein
MTSHPDAPQAIATEYLPPVAPVILIDWRRSMATLRTSKAPRDCRRRTAVRYHLTAPLRAGRQPRERRIENRRPTETPEPATGPTTIETHEGHSA